MREKIKRPYIHRRRIRRDVQIIIAGMVFFSGVWLCKRSLTIPPAEISTVNPASVPAPATTGEPLRVRQITALNADEKEPVWSPDGRHIAFVGHVTGNPDIFTVEVETGLIIQHTDYAGDDFEPKWIDNDSLLYRKRPGNNAFALDINDRNTRADYEPSLEAQIYASFQRNGIYSEDGTMAVSRESYTSDRIDRLYLRHVESEDSREIFAYHDPPSDTLYGDRNSFSEIGFSPDSRSVIFSYRIVNDNGIEGTRLYFYNISSDELDIVADYPGERGSINNFVWLSETELLYVYGSYSSGYSGYHKVTYQYDLLTGQNSVFNESVVSMPRMSTTPSGRYLYREQMNMSCTNPNFCRVLHITNLQTGEEIKRQINHPIVETEFSPDKSVDYMVFRTYGGLYIMDMASGIWDNVIYGQHIFNMAWSPDGKYIVATAGTPTPRRTFIIDVESKHIWTLDGYNPWFGHLAWSPDGQRAVYSGGTYGQHDLYMVTMPDNSG